MDNNPHRDIDQQIESLKKEEKKRVDSNDRATIIPAGNHQAIRRGRKKIGINGRARRRQAPSLFGPILIISLGIYFLLSNLNIIDGQLHWEALLGVWPLFLIFAGVNIIARQVPGVIGSMLSGAVGITAAAVFAGILLFAGQIPFLGSIAGSTAAEINHTVISQPIREPGSDTIVERAEVTLDMTQFPVTIDGRAPDDLLVSGEIDYAGVLETRYSVSNDTGEFLLKTTSQGWSFSSGADNKWDLHLSDDIPLDLTLDLASGSSTNDLSELQLTDLVIDAGSGSSTTRLPAGTYDITADMGSGSSRFIFPNQGEVDMVIDGGSGSVRLVLPSSMAARVIVDHGSGSFSPNGRLELVEGERFGDGMWQTEGYDPDNPNRIDIILDIGSGSVSIGNE